MPATLISIIGPPAAGKTTLAELLATKLSGEVIYEDYDGNPFLADSYTGSRDARLPAQLYYLFSRVKQLPLPNWPEQGLYVSDYGFCHDRIYAEAQLTPDEMMLYNQVAHRVAGMVKPPDVVVHLDADEPTLLSRIDRRGRDFEQGMASDFLAGLRNAYLKAAAELKCPVIRFDAGAADFRLDAVLAKIVDQLKDLL
jgi:deoxyadenosine/deoxycytidine kinase